MAQKILIRTPNHLGDCIMALPMISEVGEAYPGARVSILVPDYLAEIFEANPSIDEIIKLPPNAVHGLLAVMKIKDIIAPYDFDLGYVLPPSFGAVAGFKLGGINKRIGYIADGRRLLLTKAITLPAPLNAEHRSRLYFNLLLRSCDTKLEYVPPKLFLNDTDLQNGEKILAQFGIEGDSNYAVIAYQAIAESRRWGIKNYTELCKRIISKYNCKIVLMGGAEEQKTGDEMAASTGGGEVINLAGRTSIRESASIMSQAKFFVGNDSGAAHLAASVGSPLVVLSGADDPQSTSPISKSKRMIYLDKLECISCVKNKCLLKNDEFMQCMTGIRVEMVLEEINKLV